MASKKKKKKDSPSRQASRAGRQASRAGRQVGSSKGRSKASHQKTGMKLIAELCKYYTRAGSRQHEQGLHKQESKAITSRALETWAINGKKKKKKKKSAKQESRATISKAHIKLVTRAMKVQGSH